VAVAGASAPAKGRRRQYNRRHREVVGEPCGAARRLVGGGKVGRQDLAVGHPWRTVTPSPALGIAGDPYSRVAPRLHVEVRALRYSAVRRPALACVRAGDRRRTAGQCTGRVRLGTGERHTSLEGRRGGEPTTLTSRRWGTSPHGRRGRRGALRTARPSRQGAWRAGGALERVRSVFQTVNATLTARFSKKLNCATKTVDTKVVEETSLYNICKGRPMFFSTV
jgi:hypothetical protein